MSEQGFVWNKPWILQRADPYIYRHEDGRYYFTASVPAYDKIILRCANSLSGIAQAQEKEIWHKHETGPMSYHIWAPELHHNFGKWHIYFAAGQKDDIWNIRPYVLECTGSDPMGDSWIELGPMQACEKDEFSFRSFSLDATVFENRGRQYFVWSEKVGVGKQISNLYIGQMDSACTLKTTQVMLTTPDYDWERYGFWVNEGPSVIRHAGKIYLTYSASDTGVHYCMGMLSAAESDDLLDPKSWTKMRYPVLQTDASRRIFGPGHNCFTVDEKGRDIVVYHARTEDKIEGDPLYNPNRHTMLMPLAWDEKDKPIFDFANQF